MKRSIEQVTNNKKNENQSKRIKLTKNEEIQEIQDTLISKEEEELLQSFKDNDPTAKIYRVLLSKLNANSQKLNANSQKLNANSKKLEDISSKQISDEWNVYFENEYGVFGNGVISRFTKKEVKLDGKVLFSFENSPKIGQYYVQTNLHLLDFDSLSKDFKIKTVNGTDLQFSNSFFCCHLPEMKSSTELALLYEETHSEQRKQPKNKYNFILIEIYSTINGTGTEISQKELEKFDDLRGFSLNQSSRDSPNLSAFYGKVVETSKNGISLVQSKTISGESGSPLYNKKGKLSAIVIGSPKFENYSKVSQKNTNLRGDIVNTFHQFGKELAKHIENVSLILDISKIVQNSFIQTKFKQ